MNWPTRAGKRCLDEKTGAEIVRPRGDLHTETEARQRSLRVRWSTRCSLSTLHGLNQQLKVVSSISYLKNMAMLWGRQALLTMPACALKPGSCSAKRCQRMTAALNTAPTSFPSSQASVSPASNSSEPLAATLRDRGRMGLPQETCRSGDRVGAQALTRTRWSSSL